MLSQQILVWKLKNFSVLKRAYNVKNLNMPESYSNGYRLKKLYSTVHSSWKTRKFVQKSKVYSNFVMFIEGLVLGKS